MSSARLNIAVVGVAANEVIRSDGYTHDLKVTFRLINMKNLFAGIKS